MKHLKNPFTALAKYTGKQIKWVYCMLMILLVSLAAVPNANHAYSAGETGLSLQAVSPLRQQIKLTQPSAAIPGGRGYMLPQKVVVKDSSGMPVAGVSVTFEVSVNDTVTSVMRGSNSRFLTVTTDANGMASAANTHSSYLGEGYQAYSKNSGVIQTLQVKAGIPGGNTVSFDVEVGTYNSNIVDNTPPFISVQAKDDTGADYVAGTWTSRTVTVSYSAEDSISTIRSCTPSQVFSEEGANHTSTGIAIDSCNNSSSVTFGPICIDKTAPVTTTAFSKPKSGTWYDDKVTVAFDAIDNVSGVKAIFYKIGEGSPVRLEGSSAVANIEVEGVSSITYWSEDKAGNVEQARSFSVKIDKTAPTVESRLTPEKNEKGWNKNNVTLILTGMDSCSGVKEIHYKVGESGQEKIVAADNATILFDTEGISKVFYWAVDNVGKASATGNIEIKLDKSIPVITVPADISVEADAVYTKLDIGTARVDDLGEVTLENDAPEQGFPVGTTKVTWTATDSVGFVSSAVQNVTVKDTTNPVLTVQGDVVIEATAVTTPYTLKQPTATDIFSVTITHDAPEKFPVGKTPVTWKAKDANGNEVTAVQNVIVIDSKKPVLTLPKNVTVEAQGRRTIVDIGQATATDIFHVEVSSNAPVDFPLGKSTVTWKAVDANNNVTTGDQEILVQDTTDPELTIPEDITREADARWVKLDIGKAEASDIFEVEVKSNAPKDYPVGTTEVIWEARDENGNVSTKVQKITITDKTKPTFTIPGDIKIEAEGEKTYVPIELPPVYDIFEMVHSRTGPQDNMFPVGHTVITWTFTDANGNSVSFSQDITVEDTISPLLTLPEDVKVEATAVKSKVDIKEPSVSDIFPVTVTNNAPKDGFDVGTTEVTWTATDANGNSTKGVQHVTVEDKTKPVLTIPSDKTAEAKALRTVVEIGQATATDIFRVDVKSDAPLDYSLGDTYVTWTARDEHNNEDSKIQKITIIDTTKPFLAVPKDKTVEADSEKTKVALGEAEATDIFAVTVTNDAPKDGLPVGTTKVTWTATDANGNFTTGVQNITVTDKTAPVLKVPDNKTCEATAIKTPVDIGQATATDIFKVNISNNGIKDYPLGRTIVTWTATDANNNVTAGTQEIKVVDTTPPNMIPPEDMTFEATGIKTKVDAIKAPVVTDIFQFTLSKDAPEEYPYGPTLVTWTAIDVNGNKSTCTQTINIVDTTAPELTVPADITDWEATAAEGTPVELGTPVYSDIFQVEWENDAPAVFPVGTTVVTWTATDEHGNKTEKTQSVTVVDTTPPELTAPADITGWEATTAEGTPVELGTPEYSDIFQVEWENDAPAVFPVGTTVVTWTATDEHGNKTEKTQSVTVVDTTPPELTAPADITGWEATAAEGTPVELGTPEYSDIFQVEWKNDAPAVFPVGTTVVTWTATDEHGNKTEKTQSVTVVDTTPPELTAPADITDWEATAAEGTPVELGTPEYSDIFQVEWKNDAPAVFPVGTTVVTWTATDEHGNKTEKTQSVTVVDTIPPELTAPADITDWEATAAEGTPVELGTPEYSDIFQVEWENDAPAVFPVGTTVVTWTATDEHGNKTEKTQSVTVVDTIPPELTAPADITDWEATAAEGTPVELGTPVYSDIFQVEWENDAPAVFPVGTTVVTWTATDEHGNKTEKTQKVTVVDTTPPELTAPADITDWEATAAEGTPVELGTPEYSDIFQVEWENDAPAVFPVGTTVVTWTATDEHGNKTEKTQKVTVVDTTSPELTAPGDITGWEATAAEGTPVELGTPEYSDIFQVEWKNDAPAVFPVGTTVVTWTVTDEHGNKTEKTQKVTVVDTTAPELTAPGDITGWEATAAEGTPVELGTPEYSDIFKVTVTSDKPSVFPVGTTTVKWTAVDEHGNKTEKTQKVTVVDTIAPELTIPADITGKEATAADGTLVDIGTAQAKDIFEVTVTSDKPAVFPVGTTAVKWTAVDEHGNKTEKTQKVTVVDTIAPELTIPADITGKEATAAAGTPVDIGTAQAKDIFKVTVTSDKPSVFPVGTTTVKWTAVDEHGNKTEKTQKVTVVDTIAPELAIPADITGKEAAAADGTPVDIGTAQARDIFKVTVTSDKPAVFPVGTTTVKWTAVDEHGNKTEMIQKVTVVDTIAPELTIPADITGREAAAADGTPVDIGTAQAKDIFKVTVTSNKPAVFPVGTTLVKWTAVDEHGNKTEKTQKVTVVDTTKPVIKAPADITVPATGTRTKVSIGTATAVDIFKTTISSDAPADFPVGTTIVTWRATDSNGNTATATQKITVVQKLKVMSFNATRNNSTNTIDPRFMLENTGSTDINLSDIKLRYYYTVDGDMTQLYACDYAQVAGSGNQRAITASVSGRFVNVTGKANCDYYLEVSFSSSAGILKPGDKVMVQNRFAKTNWTNYTQNNDYSFNSTATDYTETSKVTVYSSGILFGGTEP